MTGRGSKTADRAPSTDTLIDIRSGSEGAIHWPAPTRCHPQVFESEGSRYEVIDQLHRGGMGEILLAKLVNPSGFSRRVVLKGLLSRLTADDVSHALFMREAVLMAQLDHPNIVRVFDLPQLDGRPYLAMEFVRGRNLHQVIQRASLKGASIPVPVALRVVSEALRGLHSAHCLRGEDGAPLGLVHRDVSPGNVLLSFYGEVKVTDFGIATVAGAPKYTAPRSIRGKARYVAPEQVHGHPATVASDIYSAGVVLAEALASAPLWERGSVHHTLMAIVTEDRRGIVDRVLRRVPHAAVLQPILDSALALDPARRPPSALRFAEILEAAAERSGTPLSAVELGLYLRDLFQGGEDVPLDDGFGPSKAACLDTFIGDEATVPVVVAAAGPALGRTSPPAVSGGGEGGATVGPGLRADSPTPPIEALSFQTNHTPRERAPSADPADAANPADPANPATPAEAAGPYPAAAAADDHTSRAERRDLGLLITGIFVGASLAIAGCILALIWV